MTDQSTGRDNAESFINEVLSDKDKIVIKYADNWPWMCNSDWRRYVFDALRPSYVFKSAIFSPPNQLDGWTFVAYRKDAKLPISQRSLDDPEI